MIHHSPIMQSIGPDDLLVCRNVGLVVSIVDLSRHSVHYSQNTPRTHRRSLRTANEFVPYTSKGWSAALFKETIGWAWNHSTMQSAGEPTTRCHLYIQGM